MTDKLGVFNGALYLIGQRKLSALDDNVESRRVLDQRWVPVVETCLEEAYWKFAVRAVSSEASDSVEPAFGYQYAHQKPGDIIRLVEISANEVFDPPLADYREESGYWYADCNPLYVRYTSNGTSFGWDVGAWTRTFANYVEASLAFDIAPRLTDSATMTERLAKLVKERRQSARNFDAMAEGAKFRPRGAWVTSRSGNVIRVSRDNGGWTV